MTIAVAALAQSPAPRPTIIAGDEWTFRQTGTEAGRNVERRWSLRIAERLPDDLITVERGNGAIEFYDDSWNRRDPQVPDYRPLDLRFPLEVGEAWDWSFDRGQSTQRGAQKVVARESIAVPAGNFECYRLEGHFSSNSRFRSETRTMTRWYCPALNYWGKIRQEIVTWDAFSPGSRSVLDSELVRFSRRD